MLGAYNAYLRSSLSDWNSDLCGWLPSMLVCNDFHSTNMIEQDWTSCNSRTAIDLWPNALWLHSSILYHLILDASYIITRTGKVKVWARLCYRITTLTDCQSDVALMPAARVQWQQHGHSVMLSLLCQWHPPLSSSVAAHQVCLPGPRGMLVPLLTGLFLLDSWFLIFFLIVLVEFLWLSHNISSIIY